jgi:hypothetical protein
MWTKTVSAVHHQQNDVCLEDRQAGLARHRSDDAVLDDGFETAGIDGNEAAVARLGLTIVPVPGQAGAIVNECAARLRVSRLKRSICRRWGAR